MMGKRLIGIRSIIIQKEDRNAASVSLSSTFFMSIYMVSKELLSAPAVHNPCLVQIGFIVCIRSKEVIIQSVGTGQQFDTKSARHSDGVVAVAVRRRNLQLPPFGKTCTIPDSPCAFFTNAESNIDNIRHLTHLNVLYRSMNTFV
jgi:hypothetical protein